MDIKQLKAIVEQKLWDHSQMIWQLEDDSSRIIADQYIEALASQFDLQPKMIGDFSEITPTGFRENTTLYVYSTETLEGYKVAKDCIILCTKTDKPAVLIPKLESWQLQDYLETLLNVESSDIEYLIKLYGPNIQRLINDLDKVAIFNPSVQNSILNQLFDDGTFDQVSNLTVNDYVTGMLKKDKSTVAAVLKAAPYIDFQPALFPVNTLANNFRKILNIQLDPSATAQSSECTDKQFYFLKKNMCKYYSNEQLIKIYSLLTNAEYLFKFGGVTTDQLIDYVTCQILGGM